MEPYTRVEKFLARASGQNVSTPEPYTRIEIYLQNLIDHIEKIDNGSGGGGSGTGLPPVTESDNGKFLQVADGVWVAVDAVPQITALVQLLVGSMFVPVSQEDYDAMVAAGTVDESKYYMIVG